MNKIKTFSFLDESGSLVPVDSDSHKIYGIGILKHTQPLQLLEKIHPIYESLCSDLKKDGTRIEFSFKSTTASSIKYDLAIIDTLLKDFEWEFNCLYYLTDGKGYKQPLTAIQKWEKYVDCTKMLIKNNLWSAEETVLIADYQRKPKGSMKKFEFIATDIPQVFNVLQVESHGVLLNQIADLFLGGYLYSLKKGSGDKEENKVRIMKKVLAVKDKVGKKKFNVWNLDWNKSSRIRRV